MPFPNPATQFKPGQTGNPAGHSRKRRIESALIALIEEKGADRAIAAKLLSMAMAGDAQFMRMLLERVDGKPIEKPDADTHADLSDDELVSRAKGVLAGTDPTRGSQAGGSVGAVSE